MAIAARLPRTTEAPPPAPSSPSFELGNGKQVQRLLPDAFGQALGAILAEQRKEWSRERERIEADAKALLAETRAEYTTLVAQLLRISSAYAPPPPEGFVSPVTWGVPEHVRERFAGAGIPEDAVACEPDTFVFEADVPPTEYLTWFRDFYGPVHRAWAALDDDGQASLRAQLVALADDANRAGPLALTVDATYLEVVATKRST